MCFLMEDLNQSDGDGGTNKEKTMYMLYTYMIIIMMIITRIIIVISMIIVIIVYNKIFDYIIYISLYYT